MRRDELVTFQHEFESFIEAARVISADLGREVEVVLREGRERPLSREEAYVLLETVVITLRRGAARRGDVELLKSLEGNVSTLVDRLADRPDVHAGAATVQGRGRVNLITHNGVSPKTVEPRPVFHEKDVVMSGGYVKITDINLWAQNERLDIHLSQFEHDRGRPPGPAELLDIMFSKMPLAGLEKKKDEFEIRELARSIANNGVRKPPIIDIDGTLLDGNRRIAACYQILSDDEFDTEQKQRAQYVYVWQLTEHATQEERDAVIVSLNFEVDCKLDWPVYIRCRHVYEEWQAALNAELERPNAQRQAFLKRRLSEKFALGPDTNTVNRYIKMAEGAIDFEDYHINVSGRPEFEVKHQANEYIEWFDELSKGSKDGVAFVLDQNPAFKHIVYDLMYEGKFQNFRQVRELKKIYENEEASDLLQKARETAHIDEAEEHLKNAMAIARTQSIEQRQLGANTRIESFCDFLEGVPPKSLRDKVTTKNLERLLEALRLVEPIVASVLKRRSDAVVETETGGGL